MVHSLRVECAQLREENNALRRHISLPEQAYRESMDPYQPWPDPEFGNLTEEDFSVVYNGYSEADMIDVNELPPDLGSRKGSTTMLPP